MTTENADMVLADAVMQMNDGIHKVCRFIVLSEGHVSYKEPTDRNLDLGIKLSLITREEMLDRLDEIGADYTVMESMYSDYNEFAKELDKDIYYAWYNNDR